MQYHFRKMYYHHVNMTYTRYYRNIKLNIRNYSYNQFKSYRFFMKYEIMTLTLARILNVSYELS